MRQDSPLCLESYPKLEAPYCLHLPVVRAVEIRLCSANMGVAHQSLDGFEVVSVIQKGCGKGVSHHMGMDSLKNQGLFSDSLDKAVNGLWGQVPFLIGTMLPQCLEEGTSRICSIPGSLQVIFDGEKGFSFQGDAPEFLPLPDHVNDGLVPVGL